MDCDSLPLITAASGLIGAVIGAAASIAVVWIQTSKQDRRAALTQAAELALADYKTRMENAPQGTRFPPASIFIAYQWEVMKLIERGKFTPEAYKALSHRYDKLYDAAFELRDERAAKLKAEREAKD
jgi:hypothetical protein